MLSARGRVLMVATGVRALEAQVPEVKDQIPTFDLPEGGQLAVEVISRVMPLMLGNGRFF